MAWISGSALNAEVTMNQSGNANSSAAVKAIERKTGSRKRKPPGGLRLIDTAAEPELEECYRHDHGEHHHRDGGGVAHAEVLEAVFEDQQPKHQRGIGRSALVGTEHELQHERLKRVDGRERGDQQRGR